jgi:hypothetical protein
VAGAANKREITVNYFRVCAVGHLTFALPRLHREGDSADAIRTRSFTSGMSSRKEWDGQALTNPRPPGACPSFSLLAFLPFSHFTQSWSRAPTHREVLMGGRAEL